MATNNRIGKRKLKHSPLKMETDNKEKDKEQNRFIKKRPRTGLKQMTKRKMKGKKKTATTTKRRTTFQTLKKK